MAPRPVTIRLLDPPIHEFLPSERQLQSDIEQLRHLRDSVRGMEVLSNSLMLLGPAMSSGQPINQIVSRTWWSGDRQERADAAQVRALTEVNPMLGHRGVRLVSPSRDLPYADQGHPGRRRLNAWRRGLEVHPQMMVPQVCTAGRELRWIKKYVDGSVPMSRPAAGRP